MKLLLVIVTIMFAIYIMQPTPILATASLPVYNDSVSSNYRSTVGNCDGEYCVVAYVAPWCGTCRQYSSVYVSLRDELAKDGIDMKIVIGRDSQKNVDDYTKAFAGTIYQDSDGEYYRHLGLQVVPYFAVINRDGEIVSENTGGFRSVSGFRNTWDI